MEAMIEGRGGKVICGRRIRGTFAGKRPDDVLRFLKMEIERGAERQNSVFVLDRG